MKKLLKELVIIIILILIVATIYITYQVIHLKLYMKNQNISVPELTSKEKEDDFRYLTSFMKDCYPYGSAVEKYKGLDNIIDLEEQYIKRAGETKNNLEFLSLFIEYSQRLGQAGHWGIQWLGTNNYNLGLSYMFGIPKDAFHKTDYWLKLAGNLSLYVHSDMKIIYSDGKYKLAQDYLLNNEKIPKESVIEKVNSLKVDEYVKTLQTKQLLRYDEQLDKVYTENLFMSNPGDNVSGWDVEFLLPSNRRYKGKVKKIDGYKNPYISKDSKGKNIICKELDEQTGYIKVSSFLQEYIEDDKKVIQDFMNNSSGKYEKLIIDVRGNIGGEPASWMDNIVRPLLKESVEINRITAVKKSYFTRMNVRYAYYRLTTTNHLLKKRINHITNIDKIEYDGLNESEWNVYKITQVLTPANNFSFYGQVYVLTDNDTLSAADSFVRVIKETKIGKVVGTNTLGWGNVFMQPNICALPNSGLMLRFDIEMPYNSDGTINSINGVKPDVNLAPSTYPTPYPINYEVSTLLEDPWIVWVMNDR